ncbi:MAG: hypothetical protein R3B90_08245 [Planctomycetaceae bacterium]
MKSLALLLWLSCSLTALAGENAAPSSHLVYDDASFPGDILINEVRVPEDGEAMFTYYERWGGAAKRRAMRGFSAPKGAQLHLFHLGSPGTRRPDQGGVPRSRHED